MSRRLARPYQDGDLVVWTKFAAAAVTMASATFFRPTYVMRAETSPEDREKFRKMLEDIVVSDAGGIAPVAAPSHVEIIQPNYHQLAEGCAKFADAMLAEYVKRSEHE